MQENQHTEYKETWRDEFLKVLCGFANSGGGKLFIGINDKGQFLGVADSSTLLEILPNKILQKLGIYANVQLHTEQSKEIITVSVDRYEVPISFNGKYYIRTGSTTQELKDKELTRFLMKKTKASWEGFIEEHADLDEIKQKQAVIPK